VNVCATGLARAVICDNTIMLNYNVFLCYQPPIIMVGVSVPAVDALALLLHLIGAPMSLLQCPVTRFVLVIP
jgi:hypothetical protein